PLVIALFCLLIVPAPQSWATCGGGGGGGGGGMGVGRGSSGSPSAEQAYPVPWRLRKPTDPPLAAGLVLYWFPLSGEEFGKSSLRNSRLLSVYAAQCVSMEVADSRAPVGQKFAADVKLPVVVLATPDGTLVGKAESKDGFLKVEQVE